MVISKVAHRIILSLFMVCLLLYCVSTVYAQPVAFPHQFYGDVTIGGEAAPPGTVVSAKVNGVESGNVTTWEQGKYGWGRGAPDYDYQANLLVQGKHISSGDTIEFYVNGVKANQTFTFQSSAMTRLDLTAASGGGGLSGGVVAGIAVGALLAGTLIVWLIMRRKKGSDNASPAP